MRALAVALLLCGCAAGKERYLLVTHTYHGSIVWSKYESLEDCLASQLRSDPSVGARCTTRTEERERRRAR